jgi:hypothetical protein
MTLTIEIAPEVEKRLEAEANRNGVSKADLAKTVLEEKFASPESKPEMNQPPKSRYLGETKMRDFSGDHEWLRQHRHEYIGKYVATYGNRLIAVGTGFKSVATAADEAGFPQALVYLVEDPDAPPFVNI